MIIGWPMVSALNRLRSAGRCQGRPPSAPMMPFRATAATSVTIGSAGAAGRHTAIGALIAGYGS